MNELIQKIIDGDHVLVEEDFIKYSQLGGNLDVMEIAVDENPNFIKYATIEYKRSWFNNKRLENNTIDIYEYALKNGYVPRGIDFENNSVLKKQECIKKVVIKELDGLIKKIKEFDYKISEDEVLNYSLIIKNVLPDYKEIFFDIILKQNHRFIKFLDVRRFNNTVNERIISNIIQGGYIPLEEDFINNKNLGFLYNMMVKAIEVNPNFIKYVLLDETQSTEIGVGLKKNIELFEKAILLGYIPHEEDIKNNYYLSSSKIVMKKAIEINSSFLRYTKVYDDDLINFAIQRGYILTKEDISSNSNLLTSNILMQKAIDIDFRYILISNEKFGTKFEKISAETIKYAIEKGYTPTKEEVSNNYNWYMNDEIMKVLIQVNPDFVELANNYEKLFDYAIINGYKPTFVQIRNNKELLDSSKLCNYLLKNDFMLYNNGFLSEYLKKDSVKGMNLIFIDQIWDFICNNTVYENMDYNEMLTIIKYVYCRETVDYYDDEIGFEYSTLKNKFSEVINNKRFVVFNEIINILTNKNILNTKYKLDLMNCIIDKFNKYYSLCYTFVSSNYNEKDVYLLRYLLLSNNDNNFDIESIDDLKKFNDMLYESRKNEIEKIEPEYDWATCQYYPEEYYDEIILMIFNMNYHEYLEKVRNGFSSKDIDVLINSIDSYDIKEELNGYKIVIKFIESILMIKDIKKLKLFAHRLNEAIYKNSEAVINIYNILRNIEDIKRYYYGVEIQEKLLNITELEQTPDEILKNEHELKESYYIRENNKYSCPAIKIFGKNLENEKVDYIELNGIDFTLFVHVLNAYGNSATLEDFKRSRLVGKTYICVSPITDKYYTGLAQSHDAKEDYIEEFGDIDDDDEELLFDISIDNINNVKLVFSDISADQLVAMGNCDLWSDADDNSLKVITERKEKYAPIRRNVASLNKKGYCEYILYREDNKGSVIYPSAVLSTEDEPSLSEIMAAAYLQVPILHINDIYLGKNKGNRVESDLSFSTHSKSQELIKNQLKDVRDILLNGFDNSDSNGINEGRKR